MFQLNNLLISIHSQWRLRSEAVAMTIFFVANVALGNDAMFRHCSSENFLMTPPRKRQEKLELGTWKIFLEPPRKRRGKRASQALFLTTLCLWLSSYRRFRKKIGNPDDFFPDHILFDEFKVHIFDIILDCVVGWRGGGGGGGQNEAVREERSGSFLTTKERGSILMRP